jgi:hypothetical protein
MTDFDERMDASGGEYYVIDNDHGTVTRGSDHKKLDLTPELLSMLETKNNMNRVFDKFFERNK